MQSLECCFSPNNAPQIARCGLVHCPDEGSMRHSSTSLVSFVAHAHGRLQNIFIINLIDNLTFRHPVIVDNPPDIKKKIIIALNFDLFMCFLLPKKLVALLMHWMFLSLMIILKNTSFVTRNYIWEEIKDHFQCSTLALSIIPNELIHRSASNPGHGQTAKHQWNVVWW